MANQYDIVIVGGGFVGLCLAHLLENTGLKILIVERNSLTKMFDPALDNRGIALSTTSCNLLHELNLPAKLYDPDSRINKVHVSIKGLFGLVNIQGVDELGYVVDSAKLGQALLTGFSNVTILENTSIENLHYSIDSQQWSFNLQAQQYSAKLLVGADGVNSLVRKTLKIDNHQLFADHTALVCNLEIMHEHGGIAYQRFIDNKVLALLPFGSKRLKCVLTFPDYLRSNLELSDIEYIHMVQNLIGNRVKILNITARICYPASQSRSQEIIAHHAVLIGNAANALSPIAAQGLNLGLRDVAVLAQLITNHGLDDLRNLLINYARKRALDHVRTSNFTKNIHKYMVNNSCKATKAAALMALELQPWFKRQIVQLSGGLA